MTLRPILGLAALLCSTTSVLAQSITPQMLRDHVAILASDAYEGREPGTAGGDRISLEGLPAGRYALRVFGAGGPPKGNYKLSVAAPPPARLTTTVSAPSTAASSSGVRVTTAVVSPAAKVTLPASGA